MVTHLTIILVEQPHGCPVDVLFALRIRAFRIPAPTMEDDTPEPTTYLLSNVELEVLVNISRLTPAPLEIPDCGEGENLETRLPTVCTFLDIIYYNIYYSRKLGLIHMSFVGKISPDIHLSPSPILIQLRNPRSSPI